MARWLRREHFLKLTLKQIRAMFAVATSELWEKYIPRASGPRVLVEMHSTQFFWKMPPGDRSFMPLPKSTFRCLCTEEILLASAFLAACFLRLPSLLELFTTG
jgi:hypothetical protein